jgi:putative transposase
MSKSKHSEAQIIAALKQTEAGRATEDVAREQGVSKHTMYAGKSKYGGMGVSEAQEVKQLREIDDITILIHGTPKILLLAVDSNEEFV